MTECTEAIQTIIECIHYICFKKILKWTKRNITGNRQLQYHAILYEALPEWQVTRIVVGFAEGSSNLAGIIWFFSIVLFGIPKVYCWLFLKKDGYCKDRRFCSCKDFLQTAIRTKGSLCLRYNFSAFGDMVYIDGTMKLGGLGWPLSASSFFKAEVLSPENVFFPHRAYAVVFDFTLWKYLASLAVFRRTIIRLCSLFEIVLHVLLLCQGPPLLPRRGCLSGG